MKIIFFGTPEFANPFLKVLNGGKNIEVLAVVTQEDKKVGRKRELKAPAVKIMAEKLGIKVFQPQSQKGLKEIDILKEADFFVVIAFGMILDKEILKIPKKAAINVHASLLPKYRGASPIHAALINGDTETGISIMKMNEKLDQGAVYFIKRIKIDEDDNLEKLNKNLSTQGSQILQSVLEDVFNEELSLIDQDDKKSTYCRKIKKEDGEIKKTYSAKKILDMIRALYPWPGVYVKIKGKKLKIINAKISDKKLESGSFLIENQELLIGTKTFAIKLLRVQMEGKKETDVKNFLNGYRKLF